MLGVFVILSIMYFLFRLFVTDKFATRNKVNIFKWVLFGFYFVSIVSLQIADTNKYMYKLCGKYKTDKAILYTIVPNVLIFGLLVMILIAFPGWKAPFSNTIGYVAASGMGIKKYFNTLLKPEIDNELMKKIIQDKSLIINEITPSNYDLFLQQMNKNGLLSMDIRKLEELTTKDKVSDSEQPYLDAYSGLYRAIVVKDLVAEGLWYILTGALVITMTKNAVAEMDCEKSTAEMKREYENAGSGVSTMESIKE